MFSGRTSPLINLDTQVMLFGNGQGRGRYAGLGLVGETSPGLWVRIGSTFQFSTLGGGEEDSSLAILTSHLLQTPRFPRDFVAQRPRLDTAICVRHSLSTCCAVRRLCVRSGGQTTRAIKLKQVGSRVSHLQQTSKQ
jgi:hypothetical protein